MHGRDPRVARAIPAFFDAASVVAIAVSLAACSSVRPGVAVAPATTCVIGSARAAAGDTLTIAAMAPVDWAHLPVPTNAAERLVFAQTYETLIDVDCERRARPGLAVSWTLDATKTRVTLSLRAGARFWSGKAVTANEVLAAWRATAAGSMSSARLAHKIADGTTVIDERTLIVSLPDTAWLVLADPALAIYEPQSTGRLPDGSGPFRPVEQSTAVPSGAFVLTPFASPTDPYLVVRRITSGDARDAIDAGADVLVTDDPVAVRYAAARANLAAVPLPWTRTYTLALPGAAPKIGELLPRPDSESVTLRSSLARDAVRADARAAQPPYWWDDSNGCGATLDARPATRTADARSNRVVYRRDDATARGLAERLVALDARTVASGLAPDDFRRALRAGGDVAYVVDLPRASLSSCDDVADLRSAAPWLASGVAAEAKLVPLIDTRETAILSRDRVPATVDWRGTLHFGGPGTRP